MNFFFHKKKKLKIQHKKNAIIHEEYKKKLLWLKNIVVEFEEIVSSKTYTQALTYIFAEKLSIKQIGTFCWKNESNGSISLKNSSRVEEINFLGAGAYSKCGELTDNSLICANSAIKSTAIDSLTDFKNFLIENILLLAIDDFYKMETLNSMCGVAYPFAAVQFPSSTLFWLSYLQTKNVALSGIFLLRDLSVVSGLMENPASILLQVSAIFDFIHTRLPFKFMHRDLHYGNIMVFMSKKPNVFFVDQNNFLVQDGRDPKACKKIIFETVSKLFYAYFKFIDFGFAWMQIDDNVLCTTNGVYNSPHAFNAQHDLRQLVISFYDSYCVNFNKKTKTYSLNKKNSAYNIVIQIVAVAARHSVRFKMVTNCDCLTEIHRYVNSVDDDAEKNLDLKLFDKHAEKMTCLIGNGATINDTRLRLKSLYEVMYFTFKQQKHDKFNIAHIFYSFMVEHKKTPLFEPKNLFSFIVTWNDMMKYQIVKL